MYSDIKARMCKKCGRELPLTKYSVHSSNGKRRKVCKDCYNRDRREKHFQQKMSDGLVTYRKDKSMKIQRKYKKPYDFQILYRSESGCCPAN